ncbi:MAG: hypothetical protein WC557_00695 [Ignavibacteriaceae bacterium]
MNGEVKTINEISNKAINLLLGNLGAENTLRFLNQFSAGFGDYTKERKNLYKNKSLDQLVFEIKNNRKIRERNKNKS